MKLDERDIICEQDYSPLSNAELVAHIERYAGLMHSTPLSDGEWLDDILGPARALLARVEAAEALAYERLEGALFAEQRADDAEIERDSANVEAALEQSNAREAWQRVSELEAQLAAQQWRPVTEKPLSTAQNQVVVMHGNRRPMADHMAYYLESGWAGTDVIFWRPIPPLPDAPDVQEPTP